MIVTFAVIGILFSTLDILVRPLFHSHNICFIYFTLGSSFRRSKTAAELGLLVYCAFYSMILAPGWAKHFDGWKYALWLLYTLVSGILWALASNLDRPDEVTLNYMRSEVLQNYGVEIRSVPHFAVLAYVLSSHSVAAPTLFFQLPGFVILIFPFFDFKISFHSGVVIYGFSAYPLVDTLIVFKVITEYKIAYKRFVSSFAKDCIEMLGGDSPRNPPPSYTRKMAYAS
ncbi:unnamed protein product [Caenorhabditis brenneri]